MSKIIQISWVSHNAAFTSAFTNLRDQNVFCDVTVCSRGNYFPAHRLILSAFSDYFKEILEQTPCKHPFILVQDANGEDLKALLDFIYVGEISVESERMESFLKLAQNLEVRGFTSPIKGEEESSISCPAPPSEFCVNMTELGKRVQNPGVEESYEVPEPPKKNWGPKSKRKRRKETPPLEGSVEESPLPTKITEESSPPTKMVKETFRPDKMAKDLSPPKKKVREASPNEISPPRKTGKVLLPPTKTTKPKRGRKVKESTPPSKLIEPKQEPLEDDFQMTAEADKSKTLMNTVGKPMVLIENCPAAVELSSLPKDEQVSVMIPPIENCITLLGDSDDDFFDDDFPSDPSSTSREAESIPIEDPAPKDEIKEKLKGDDVQVKEKRSRTTSYKQHQNPIEDSAPEDEINEILKCDDVQGKEKRSHNTRSSETSKSKRAKKDTQKQEDIQENSMFSPGTSHHTQEHFQFVVKEEEEGELDCQNGSTTSAATSNHSPVEKREAIKVTFKVKDKDEMSYDIVSPRNENVPESPSVFEASTEAGTSREVDEEEKKKTPKKRKGKKERFECQYCPYKTPIAVNLRVHLRIHTGEKPFVCSLCPYKSTQGSALRTHMQTHLQNKRVKCPHCEFNTRFGHEELKEHLKSHTDTTTYQCEECSFVTSRYQTLQRHELKHHFKSTNLYFDEDSSQPKKSVKKCNPYKSRKRSMLSKKLMAKRKQKAKSLVTKKSTVSKDDGNTPSTKINTNENLSSENKMEDEINLCFDSPKIKSPCFEGFADDAKASPDISINPSNTCETPNAPSCVTTSSLGAPSCATIIPNVSICTTANTLAIQSSAKETPNVSTCVTTNVSTCVTTNVCTCVTTNTSTTLTTIYPKVLANTTTTLCLVKAIVSQPSVLKIDPLPTVSSVRGIQLISLPNNICQPPVVSSNSTLGANEEPFMLPKVTNVYGRVPFPSSSIISTSCAEGTTLSLENLDSNSSPGFSLPDASAEKDPLSLSPQTLCEDSIENVQEENPPEITITSVSSGVAFNEAPYVPCSDIPPTKNQVNNTSNDTEGSSYVPRASTPSNEDNIEESPPCLPCPDPSTEDDIIEVPPCIPCEDVPSTEDPFNNSLEDIDEPHIRITSISTCSDDGTF